MNTAVQEAMRTVGNPALSMDSAVAAAPASLFAVPVEYMLAVAVVALIAAIVVVCVLAGQMKTAEKNTSAAQYIDEGSLQLHVNSDQFLYRTEERRKIETNTNKEKA